MEEKFVAAWLANREQAARLGVRMRPVASEEAMKTAHRCPATGKATGLAFWRINAIWS